MFGAISADSLTPVTDDGEGLRDAARKLRQYCEQLCDVARRAGRAWSQLPTVLYADRLTPVLEPLMEPAVRHAAQLSAAAGDFYRVASSAADDLADVKHQYDRLVTDIDDFHASAPGKTAQHAASQAAAGNLLGAAVTVISSWRDVPTLVADEAELRWRANSYENNLTDTLNGIAARINAIDAPTALNGAQLGNAQAAGYVRTTESTPWWESAWHSAENIGKGAWSWTEDEGKKALPYLQDFAAQTGNDFLSLAQAIHDHPGEFGTFVAGIAVIAAGGSEEVIGGALDATGIGALAGVPVNVAGAATIAAGAGLTGAGASGLINHAMSDDAKAPLTKLNNSDGSDGLDIENPSTFNPESVKGMTSEQLEESIPKDWTKVPSKTGGGDVYKDPNNFGRQIRIMPGYEPGTRPDLTAEGPYAVISQNGEKIKVPLQGNPVLK